MGGGILSGSRFSHTTGSPTGSTGDEELVSGDEVKSLQEPFLVEKTAKKQPG
jgi:hypothetical protein